MKTATSNEIQSAVTVQSLFDDILECHENEQLIINDKYEALYHIFLIALKERTKDSPIAFAGPFPRMSYLCKKHQLPEQMYGHINAFRLHGRANQSIQKEELESDYRYDLKALTDFLAAIYAEEPANKLKELLRFPYKKYEKRESSMQRIRVAVDCWDNDFIYGRNANSDADLLKIAYTENSGQPCSFDYIGKLLAPNTQINLIRPTVNDGIYYPELMIYEPDFLIDISSIAACFSEYGNTAVNYLINKIKPSGVSAPILLGNFAGQLLDELINKKDDSPLDYKESVKRFFRNNAIDLATCKKIDKSFHDQAQTQLFNLNNIIHTKFRDLSNIKMEQIVLEPSFFCELLGIQGRMDLLQADYSILMEQKSGQRDFATHRHKEAHYVQMLLYQAILHYAFARKNEHIASYLLYSKYADGLIEEGPAPTLLREALQIRNEIVHSELSYTNEDEVERVFDQLTPELLNIKRRCDKLWREYQEPQLRNLLASFKNASEIEKSYFCRFFAFIEKENILSKIGSPNRENDGFSSIWNATLKEKKQTGDIYNNLQIIAKESTQQNTGFDLIRLQIPNDEDDFLSNFRVGDVVILYSYPADSEPDALHTMVLRGNVKEIKYETIEIKLRFPQRNEFIFQSPSIKCWAIEHDYMEASYNALYKSLYSFLNATAGRRELLMNRRAASCNTNITLNGEYGSFNELVLRAKQAQDYFLLIGPPGTGKTSFGLVNILKETLTDTKASVLLASFTNRAVDEICSKLVQHHIPFVRIGSELSCDPAYHEYLLYNRMSQCPNVMAIRELFDGSRVVVGTTSSLTAHKNIFEIKHFELAIVDEASQILEPQLLGLFCARQGENNAIDKFVFIGDYKQLPAVVQQSTSDSNVQEETLRNIGLTNCRHSLFERFILLQREHPQMSYLLTRQGRMHPDVAAFANKRFYKNKLQPVPVSHQKETQQYSTFDSLNKNEVLLATHRLCFIASEGYHTNAIKINIPEAKEISAVVQTIYQLYKKCGKTFNKHQTIGVIVPYRNQIATIRKELNRIGIDELSDITIDTVERYQGSERDIIIYGFTIHKYYQLDFLTNNTFYENGVPIDRKLNVAMTRAREQMILVGNPTILNSNIVFKGLIDYIKTLNGYVDSFSLTSNCD